MKRYLVVACVSVFLMPFAASAQSAGDLQAQIAALIAQIQALQQARAPQSVPTNVGAPSSEGLTCPHISRTLKRGASGVDVTRLQQFLALDPSVYPDPQVTGYYGALTEAAVQRFQCKNKLVCDGTPETTGYGVTGPRTAALLALQCPDILGARGAQVGGFIKLTPVSGAAPVTATIEVTVNTTRSCSGAPYELDFGDGSPAVQIPVAPGVCSELRQILTHTYPYGGTYVITLRSGVHRTTATLLVTGGPPATPNGGSDSLEVNVTSGQAPFTATFTGIVNATGVCNAGPYTLVFGDGASAPLPISGCSANAYTVTHQYTRGGNFIATLRRGNPAVDVGSRSIAVSGGTGSGGGGAYGGFFAVSPVLGSDTVDVTAQFEIETSCTAYDLDWGDGTAHQIQSQGSCGGGVVAKQFTHDYASPGTYTITLRRGPGFAAVDSASVTISD